MDKRVLRERMRKKQQQLRRRRMMRLAGYVIGLILVVVFIAVLPLVLEERGVWLTMPCSETVTVLVALWLYRREGRPPEAAMK